MREVIELDPTWSYAIFQSFYILPEREGLHPNRVFVRKTDNGSELYFETNSWGLKGPEPEAGKPTLVVWGDSVVFGVGRSWVEMLNDLQAQICVLNGGMEGDEPLSILGRMIPNNEKHKIDTNIYFPGWHGRPGSACQTPSDWKPEPTLDWYLPRMLERKKIPNFILCTVPTWLSPELLGQDIAAHFRTEGGVTDTFFNFWGNEVYSPEYALRLCRFMEERNNLMRETAKKYNLGLIDLAQLLPFSTMEKAKEYFFDICHFRPAVYGELSQILLDELKRLKLVA